MFIYKIHKKQLQIFLFGKFQIFSLPLSDIIAVEKISVFQMIMPHPRTIQLVGWSNTILEIKYKNGWCNRLLISPDNSEIFLTRLKSPDGDISLK